MIHQPSTWADYKNTVSEMTLRTFCKSLPEEMLEGFELWLLAAPSDCTLADRLASLNDLD